MPMGLATLVYLLLMLTAEDAKLSKPEVSTKADAPVEKNVAAARAELNLQGQVDAASGESRRNENIQFNPIDNNAIKELNVRMGTTATIINEFEVTRNYF